MQFSSPGFLYAFLLLAIPINIHLFNFKKHKKLYFSNISFLKKVNDSTNAKNKLKHILILFSRLLLLTFLILAFARPYIPIIKGEESSRKMVGLFIDQSFSMSALSSQGNLLDRAKEMAKKVVSQYSESDQFFLISSDGNSS